jgi:hypothetical protein
MSQIAMAHVVIEFIAIVLSRSTYERSILIRGGTVVNADRAFKADV